MNARTVVTALLGGASLFCCLVAWTLSGRSGHELAGHAAIHGLSRVSPSRPT